MSEAPSPGDRTHRASWESDKGQLNAGKYMEHKEAELRRQRAPKVAKGCLTGVVIWFNGLVEGYTTDEILALVAQHGGQVEHHFRVRVCTHVIASTLASSKIKMLQEVMRQSPVHVVTPTWLTESVATGRCVADPNHTPSHHCVWDTQTRWVCPTPVLY